MNQKIAQNKQQTTQKYLPRIADGILERKLQSAGAVHIVGPKWCGKTATAQQHSRRKN